MTAQQFLSELGRQELVPRGILQNLERQVSSSGKPIPPETVARLLVEKGHLTAEQSQTLLAGRRPSAATVVSAGGGDELVPLEDLSPVDPLDDLQPLDDAALAPLGEEALAPLGEESFAPLDEESFAPLDEEALSPLGEEALAPLGDASAAPLGGSSDDLFGDALPASGPIDLAHAQVAATATAPAAASAVATQPAARGGKTALIVAGVVGVVVVLFAIGGVALLVLPRGDGTAEFEQALATYESKQYGLAAEQMAAVVADYPRSSRAGEARGRLAMARILAAKDRGAASAALLPVVEDALADVANVADLSPIHADLGPLLANLALDLTGQARDVRSADAAGERLAEAQRALALADNGRYLPGALRPWQALAEARETLALLEYQAGRAGRVAAALASIDQAISAKNAAAAADARAALLRSDPEAAGDGRLRDTGPRIAQAAAESVQPVEAGRLLEEGGESSAVVARVAFAPKTATADGSRQPCFVMAAGSVWALDSAGGGLLWQRPAAGGPLGGIATLSNEAASDVVFVAASGTQIVCVAGQSGAVRWWYEVDSPIVAAPVIAGSRVIAATRDGKVIALDGRRGEREAAVQLPFGIRVPPVYDRASQALYVVADRLHAFVLDADSLQCRGAVSLGHEAASVAAPPVLSDGRLVVAENIGPAQCRLHVVSLDGQTIPRTSSQQIELPGNVLTAPATIGSRLYVATDGGIVHSFAAAADGGLSRGGELKLPAAGRLLRYQTALDGALWLADEGLRSYRPAADGGLEEQALLFSGANGAAPPHVADGALVCVRREPGRPELVAAAVESNGRVRWETPLAAPIVAIAKQGGEVHVLTSLSTSARVNANERQGNVVLATTAGSDPLPPIAAGIRLANGRRALIPANNASEIHVAGATLTDVRKIVLPAPRAGMPVAWSGGILVPCLSGTVWLLDSETGSPLAAPLQLPIVPGRPLRDCRLAAHEDDVTFVVSGGGMQFYVAALEAQPVPHLTVRSQAALPDPIAGPLAVDASGNVLSFSDATFGPQRVGDVIVVIDGDDRLVCLDGTEEQWARPFDVGPLAGSPIAHGGRLILTTASGTIVSLDAATGDEVARVAAGQPLGGDPLVVGASLLVPAADGSLLKVSLPERKPAAP